MGVGGRGGTVRFLPDGGEDDDVVRVTAYFSVRRAGRGYRRGRLL